MQPFWEDYDNDGRMDLFVANDFGRNNLYRNEGSSFRHVTKEVGADDDTFGMSAASGDIDRDGWMDFYKANMYSSAGNRVVTQPGFLPKADDSLKDRMLHLARGNTLLRNRQGKFTDESIERNVEMGRWSVGLYFSRFQQRWLGRPAGDQWFCNRCSDRTICERFSGGRFCRKFPLTKRMSQPCKIRNQPFGSTSIG